MLIKLGTLTIQEYVFKNSWYYYYAIWIAYVLVSYMFISWKSTRNRKDDISIWKHCHWCVILKTITINFSEIIEKLFQQKQNNGKVKMVEWLQLEVNKGKDVHSHILFFAPFCTETIAFCYHSHFVTEQWQILT